ncbi:MAG: aminotransferase class I/II-fold pyridoxal phosphate-dependent enzyme, partial [Phycisphaerales bacterium]|nr:aminotransferase class I/II-fold pyridoxal phosphate-dependent enzyme [Phycisphaerales bacterium]
MIDLRSDTVTRPTEAMWASMHAAPLGDDVLGDEPSVQSLEARVAKLTGKEAALFTPSGTMANQLAIRCACESGDEIIAHRESHIIHYETGAPAALSGCMIAGVDGEGGLFTAEDVLASLRTTDIHDPHSRMVSVENSHNRGGGSIWPLAQFNEVAAAAHEHGLHVHVDGARLMNACTAGGYTPREFVTNADTVSMCFSKALGAPVGSALAGPADLIVRARRFRKMFGGGMRQSGLLAAAATHALEHHVDGLATDHANAEILASRLNDIAGITVEAPAGGVRTNMVFFDVAPEIGDAATFCRNMADMGVAFIDLAPRRVRAVTHLDVS